MKEISDEDKEKYSFGDYWLIQNQILLTNIKRIVWQIVRIITNENLGVKGLNATAGWPIIHTKRKLLHQHLNSLSRQTRNLHIWVTGEEGACYHVFAYQARRWLSTYTRKKEKYLW